MLRRLVRHRLFVLFLVLVVAGCILATPLKHDYFTSLVKPANCTALCGEQITAQVTEVSYGAPWGWFTLGQQTDANGKIIRNYTKKTVKNLAFDGLVFVGCLVIILPMTKPMKHSLLP